MLDKLFGRKRGEDVVEAEFHVLTKNDVIAPQGQMVFTGRIVSTKDGYCYINSIRRGYETINTNGDVFCPMADGFVEGDLVEFWDLNTDHKRDGKFRTEEIRRIEDTLLPVDPKKRAMAVYKMTQRHHYHLTAKKIAPEAAVKAAENRPFGDFIMTGETNGADDMVWRAEDYLRGLFANLADIVEYSLGEINIQAETAKYEEMLQMYQADGMAGQIDSLEKEYSAFCRTRELLRCMNNEGILRVENFLPYEYLPDLVTAFPVVYTFALGEGIKDQEREDDPSVHDSVKFICDKVGSREFSWFYQIYNRRLRPFSAFSGRDTIPAKIMKIMKQAKEICDYVLILTPYHDVASREWQDPNWLRNIDPIAIGFLKTMDRAVILGRWSQTNHFALVCDMVADTMEHLRQHASLLSNFSTNTYWYMGLGGSCLEAGSGGSNGVLRTFANNLLQAYDENRLFDFLRGKN